MTVFLVVLIGIGLGSCKKDEPSPVIVENPLDAEIYYVSGKVTAGDAAVDGVKVSITESEAITSDDGTFLLELTSKGDYMVTFEKEGYVTVSAAVSIPADLPKQSTISLLQELTKMNPAVTVSPDTGQIIVEIKRELVELALSAGAVKTATDIIMTDFKEGSKHVLEGTIRASLSTVNCEPDGQKFEIPALFRMKNPMSNDIYFDGVKHFIEDRGNWIEEGETEYDNSGYHVTTLNGFSNHSFGVYCSSRKGTSRTENIASVVIDNLGEMGVKEQMINFTQHVGWIIDGVTTDLLEKQLAGIGDSDLTALSETIEAMLASLMGSAPGISEINWTRDALLSGDTKIIVNLFERMTPFIFSFPVIFQGEGMMLHVPVLKYERVEQAVSTEYGPSYGGVHSGGLIE